MNYAGGKNREPNATSDFASVMSDAAGYCIVDGQGNPLVIHGANKAQADLGRILATTAPKWGRVGQLLGIGQSKFITTRGRTSCWVMASRDNAHLAVAVDSKVSCSLIEEQAALGGWVPRSRINLEDSDVECVSSRHLTPLNEKDLRGLTSATATPGASDLDVPVVVDTDAGASEGVLRRALADGDLRAIAGFMANLTGGTPHSASCKQGGALDSLTVLVQAIAAVLCGDSDGALRGLEAIAECPEVSPSIRWATALWSARASIGMSEGLDSALVYAESAARASKVLDIAARVVSNRLLAEVGFHRREPERVARHLEIAKRLLDVEGDGRTLSTLALLQAKAYLLQNDYAAAAREAQLAYESDADSGEAISTLFRCALQMGDISMARKAIGSASSRDEIGRVLRRLDRLLQAVENKQTEVAFALEFLSLEEQIPTRENIARLSAICQALPLDLLQDSFGWKLLRAGRTHRAKEVFARLSQQQLSEDVRVSASLALGWLAVTALSGQSSEAKLRAAIRASAPLDLEKPARTMSGVCQRLLSPLDCSSIAPPLLRTSQPPTSAARGRPSVDAERTYFSGELQRMGLAELVQFLALGLQTGTLLISSSRGSSAIQFFAGRIAGAITSVGLSFLEALGDGNTAEIVLLSELAHQDWGTNLTIPFGTLLIRERGLRVQDVVGNLRQHVEQVIVELASWDDGLFAFAAEEQVCEAGEHLGATLDAITLTDLLLPRKSGQLGSVA